MLFNLYKIFMRYYIYFRKDENVYRVHGDVDQKFSVGTFRTRAVCDKKYLFLKVNATCFKLIDFFNCLFARH